MGVARYVDDANLHAGTLIEVTASKQGSAFTDEERAAQLPGERAFTYNRRGDHHLIAVPAGMTENDMAEFLQTEARACEE
eukprot:6686546-Alexandrium_andersonii.AAC.1